MVQISILNVGYGSAALIQSSEFCAIIDCKAPDIDTAQSDMSLLNHRNPVDLLVLTHQHRDHWSGVPGLLNRGVEFTHCWITPYVPAKGELHINAEDQTEYEQLLARLAHSGTHIEAVSRSASHVQGNVLTISVLNPTDDIMSMQNRQVHDGCLVIRCDSACGSVLFGSDATINCWRRIVDWDAAQLRTDYFVASHHGADDGIDAEILARIQPSTVILSTEEGRYPDTPHPDIVALFQNCTGNQVFRTDKHGAVTIMETGIHYSNTSVSD